MKKVSLLTGAVAMLFMLSSCGSGTIYPQNEGGGKAVKDLVLKNFDPEKQVQELQIKAKDELYGDLGEVTVVYWEGDKQMEQVYDANNGLSEPKETFASKNNMKAQMEKTKTIAIKDFNLEPIPNNVGEAVGLIPDGYENYALNEYIFSFDNNGKAKQGFKIHATKKGEGKSQNGRMVSTNYYEFKFKLDEGGKIMPIEN